MSTSKPTISLPSGFSTETQLLTSINNLLTSFSNQKQADMAFLDFSKAFSTVPHDRLLHKTVQLWY